MRGKGGIAEGLQKRRAKGKGSRTVPDPVPHGARDAGQQAHDGEADGEGGPGAELAAELLAVAQGRQGRLVRRHHRAPPIIVSGPHRHRRRQRRVAVPKDRRHGRPLRGALLVAARFRCHGHGQ